MPPNHEVKQGDTISSIAHEHGFQDETIWDHPNNAKLRQKRDDPNVLMAGDVVFVPDPRLREVSAQTGQPHAFRAKTRTKVFAAQLLRLDQPIANMEYEIQVDAEKWKGKTDEDGWLRVPIPPDAKRATLVLGEGQEYRLALGRLDPVDQDSGVQERLRTLGYYRGPVRPKMDGDAVEALKTFQAHGGLDPTGEADARTRALLRERAGA